MESVSDRKADQWKILQSPQIDSTHVHPQVIFYRDEKALMAQLVENLTAIVRVGFSPGL